MKKSYRILVGLLAIALMIGFVGCSAATSTGSTDTGGGGTTPMASSRSGFPSNGATVPVDQISALRWNVVQSAAVSEYDPTLSVSTTPVIDAAKTAKLYFDVSFGKSTDPTPVVHHIPETNEWASAGVVSVNIQTILGEYFGNAPNPSLTVGETYSWQVTAVDSLGNKFETPTYTFVVAPPHPSAVAIGHDFRGYYFEWSIANAAYPGETYAYSYGYNEEPICDLLVAPSATFSPAAAASATAVQYQGSDGSGAKKRAYRVYASAITGLTFAADTNYTARVVVRDTPNSGTSSVQTFGEVVKLHSDPVLDSGIDLSGSRINATAPLTVSVVNPTITFDPIKNADGTGAFVADADYASYDLYIGATALAVAKVGTVASSAALGNLAYNTTYFIQLRANRASDASVVAGPVLQFTTPSFANGTVYNFQSTTIAPSLTDAVDPSTLTTTGTPATAETGNPAPSLSLAKGTSIITAMKTPMNSYMKATLQFDFLVPDRINNNFSIKFDNQKSASTFSPYAYSIATPSATTGNAIWSDLRGLSLAVKYSASDPHTTTGLPVFKLYAYSVEADNAVDIDVATAGSQQDADTLPDIKETDCGSLLPNTWYTIKVAVDLTTSSMSLQVYKVGTTAPAATVLSFGAAALSSFEDQYFIDTVRTLGIDRMEILGSPTTSVTAYIDNLSYTVADTSYTRGL